MNNEVLAIILGGGQGSRLFPLTQLRSKPAVPIGGKYRLIDVPISNCLHADLRRIFVLTQFNSASLNRRSTSPGSNSLSMSDLSHGGVAWRPGTARPSVPDQDESVHVRVVDRTEEGLHPPGHGHELAARTHRHVLSQLTWHE